MACPGSISTFRLVFTSAFRDIFSYVLLELDCNGKTYRCAVLGCNNDLLFPVKDHISNTKRVHREPTLLFVNCKWKLIKR